MKLLHDLAAILSELGEAEIYKFCTFFEKYSPHLAVISSSLYEQLDGEDQRRFLLWFLKRWAKLDLVNAVESGLYRQKIQSVKEEPRPSVELDGEKYLLRDFSSQGYPLQLLGYDWFLGVHDIFYNQYEHKGVTLSPGDVIIDAGAFIGDTAVLFHHKLAGQCEIHSFELLDENIALMQHNLQRNGVCESPAKVVINKIALTDVSGGEIVISPGKSEGSTSIFGTDARGERVATITLDDYVIRNHLTRVDFIKMDIEGAELAALVGARRTIQHFKPKLAICLYHKWDDPITIPKFIHSLGVDYAFSFKWVQLTDGWEAVLLAAPASKLAQRRATTTSSPSASIDALQQAMTVLTKAYLKKWAQADSLWREKQRVAKPQAEPAVLVSA